MDVRMCPECGEKSKIMDVRDRTDGTVRRRRRCLECGKEWKTVEICMKDYLLHSLNKEGE